MRWIEIDSHPSSHTKGWSVSCSFNDALSCLHSLSFVGPVSVSYRGLPVLPSMAFLGFPFVFLRGAQPEATSTVEIDRNRMFEIFRYSSHLEAEAIENILDESYRFNSRHARTDSDIASTFISFCLLIHTTPSVVEFIADDLIYPIHQQGLHDELVDFSLLDPLLWVKEVDELALRPASNGFSFCSTLQIKSQTPTHPTLPKSPAKPHLGHSNDVGILIPPSKHTVFNTQLRNLSSERDDDESEFYYNRDTKEPPKLFVVQPRVRPDYVLQAKLLEAINLADSLEEQREEGCGSKIYERKRTPHLLVQNPGTKSTKSHADAYFGQGTVETVKIHVNAIDAEDGLDAVFVNAMLTGIQQRNLERVWGKPVFDRMGLIIEIFNAHANTKEAKLQAELAALMYKKTRLVRVRGLDGRLTFGALGEAEVVSGRGRTSGGRGFISGAGETELQLQRRRILERRNQLLSEIEEVRRTRALQRVARKRHGKGYGRGMPVVAVVGYTNAGKSSLVAGLSQSDLYIDDKLFATLDPRVRSIFLPSGQKVLLSDTVGFISDLPVQLVEAFQATLDEVTEADLLMHVIDASAPNAEEHRDSVLDVLQQIGVSSEKIENMIEVWNKVDLLESGTEKIVPTEDLDHERSEDCNNEICLDRFSEDFILQEADAAKGSSNGATLSMSDVGVAETSNILAESRNANLSPNRFSYVKTSAITGIGLQELLHLLDEKLDEKPKPAGNLEDKYFVKWRPSFSEVLPQNAE
ncbi:hypothetical protein KI387_022546 [Taxus chinensis]|uniref:Hflx-type G domain-containing protein n=1 Tax=Taxus chinensis TaxID=29808 RepID=A0AA38G318_TAXCH|nr:hypothetical protein KI387_022546 [Taxus chinensis]